MRNFLEGFLGIEGALVDPAFDVSHYLPADRLSQGDGGAEGAGRGKREAVRLV